MPPPPAAPPPEAPGPGTHRFGLVSDTHGLFRPLLEEVLRGVEGILHAGDVGGPEVLRRMRRIAPVTAVSGNVDYAVAGLALPAFERVELYGLRVLITHYVGAPDFSLPPVAKAINTYRPGLVVSGHTHRPEIRRQEGILYVNPGSCGPRRLDLPIACAILTLTERSGAPKFVVTVHDLESGTTLLDSTKQEPRP